MEKNQVDQVKAMILKEATDSYKRGAIDALDTVIESFEAVPNAKLLTVPQIIGIISAMKDQIENACDAKFKGGNDEQS